MPKTAPKKSQKYFSEYLVFVAIVLIFIVIRLFHLPDVINFGSDDGRDFLTTRNMYTNKQIVVLGPPSQYSVEGRRFFFGPAPYYVILPALILGNWDPLFVSYYLIFLNAAVLLFTLLILRRYINDIWVSYLFAFFCTFTPVVITLTRSYWNPYFMLAVSTLLLVLLVISKKKPVNATSFFVLIGFLFGLGFQFHYSFILAITVSMVWLLVHKKLSARPLFALLGGFIVGFLPIIAYELKNDFYNFKTLILVFTSTSNANNDFQVNGVYYFISLLPFLFFLLALLLAKLKKLNSALLYALLGIFVLCSAYVFVSRPTPVFTYPQLQAVASVIEGDKPTDFNIVDQLTRDNRAMALRYLLTVHGFVPHTVEDYQSSKSIYIYSKEPLANLLKDPVYEIKSFLPFRKIKIWQLENRIFLYKLEK